MHGLIAWLVVSSTGTGSTPHADLKHRSPEPYVSEALAAHPSLEAAHRRVQAARHRRRPAGALADPVLSVGIQNLPYTPPSVVTTPMTGIRFGISQSFPWPGKRALAEDVASLRADVAQASREEQANHLASRVRATFYDIHFADISIQVIHANLGIIDGFVEITDAKYRVGRGLQQDVLKARVLRNQLEERLLDLRRERAALAVRLNSLMAVEGNPEVPPLVNVAVTELPPLNADALMALAETQRPLLQRLTAQRQTSTRIQDLADKAALPDFSVTFGYTWRLVQADRDPVDGGDFLSLSAGINLPVWYTAKQGPRARAARDDTAAAKADLAAARLEVRSTIHTVLEQGPKLLQQMELYRRSIIPTTRQTFDADRIAYQVDKVDFLDLLDIEMRLLNFEVDYHRLHVEREKLIVRLAEAVGIAPADLRKAAR